MNLDHGPFAVVLSMRFIIMGSLNDYSIIIIILLVSWKEIFERAN